MYTAIIVLLLIGAGALILAGARRQSKPIIGLGLLVAALTWMFFWFMGFWSEFLWFDAVGYGDRFWTVFLAKIGCAVGGAVLGGGIVLLATWPATAGGHYLRPAATIIGGYIGANAGAGSWDTVLRFFQRVETGVAEPILNLDTGFYLFVLPALDTLFVLGLALAFVSLAIYAAATVFHCVKLENGAVVPKKDWWQHVGKPRVINGFYRVAAAAFLLLAVGYYLKRFHLLYSEMGVVAGPGWTDVHIRMPAYLLTAVVCVAAAVVLAMPAVRGKLVGLLPRKPESRLGRQLLPLAPAAGVVVITAILALSVAPGLAQWLRVEPNEITLERPYIANNIEFTRRGFGLDDVEEREFPASPEFNQQLVDDYQHIIDNVRLWDWRALQDVHKQFQEIRLYYEFADVDIDRYKVNGDYRQLMASAREMEVDNLPVQSQTFVNKRFKYTHGYGLTLTPVHEFTSQGLPNFLVKDIPPKSRVDGLKVDRPEIYYGELTDTYVVANSSEEEFDYPQGEENVYVHYQGDGGVPVGGLWRKFLYGYRFDGTRFLLSGYPREGSRIMFHRQIEERLSTLAPFLRFDQDPYIVLDDGELYWIVDAYTTSARYPYSEPFYRTVEDRAAMAGGYSGGFVPGTERLAGDNYIRNSVKAVVNAYDGSVSFYVFEPDDPLIRVWQKIFPGLFQAREEMPDSLEDHVRYPADMLLTQGLVYAKYHMTDPAVFYNQEDLWVRATEKYYNQVRPVDPYYIMWEQAGSDQAEYVLIQPFTPKDRQVIIGWIAGMCDGENYGKFLAYKFPKERRVLGPQQIETKIDQDRHLSGQLTLWDQRGSNVIRGNVLAIPLGETLLYVEPIFLQAETAAYPELRLVVLMHDDQMHYANSFDEALEGLLEGREAEAPGPVLPGGQGVEQLVKSASGAFEDYLGALSEKRFTEAGRALEALEQALSQLENQFGAESSESRTNTEASDSV